MKITLCGSTKFRDEFLEANRRLTSMGHIVYSVAFYAHAGEPITDTEKLILDAVHMGKIEESDAIYVVNPGGYIGESTEREIYFALIREKYVVALVSDQRLVEIISRVDTDGSRAFGDDD